MRPWFFWIDEIGCQRRNSAPVINACIEQLVISLIGQVRRRLQIHLWHEQSRSGSGSQEGSSIRFRPALHGNLRFRAEILHDHFLDVPIPIVQFADSKQRVDPVLRTLTYANKQSCRERDSLLARLIDYAQSL